MKIQTIKRRNNMSGLEIVIINIIIWAVIL
jgi:hypothetical protein